MKNFLGFGNVLFLYSGDGYIGIYICNNSSSCTLSICPSLCIYAVSQFLKLEHKLHRAGFHVLFIILSPSPTGPRLCVQYVFAG